MRGALHSPRSAPMLAAILACGMLAHASGGSTSGDQTVSDPISRLARIVNPKLVMVEDRVAWLDKEVSSLARYVQFPLHYGLGFRGHRPTENDPDPTITLDLGKTYPIDHIYLVPCQGEYLNDLGIFPQSFTIEVANSEDFRDAELLFRTGPDFFRPIGGIPVEFSSLLSARYIRLSVHKGHSKGAIDLFGLSEFFVISGGVPVSFNARVHAPNGLDIENIWYPGALIDGRTPLGMWHHGNQAVDQIGDAVIVGEESPASSWQVRLPAETELDRVVLFPYQIRGSYDISLFPQSISINVTSAEQPEGVVVHEWSNPIPGTNSYTPLVFPMRGMKASTVTVTATAPWVMGHRRMNAISELQVWSAESNLASGQTVTRIQDGRRIPVLSLTDGFTSQKNIAPMVVWLDQLTRRGKIEQELDALRSIYTQLASRSELNVSWGAAVILGLTFLIPVFIFEKKRMHSKEHLDIIRKRIASDLHDDIGSNLGSISLIARTARKDLARLNGPAEIDNDLGEVEMIARESSLAMRDIVWLLERKQDSIGDLVHRMRETAGRLLRETDFSLECTSTRMGAKLTLDAKRHLFLFYKEAIHNVVKHSQATRVSIRLWDEGEQLGMEILDNGVGLPTNRDRVSIGVKKLEDRAEVLGGIIQVTSSAETGTCIRLLVKRSNLTSHPKAS